MKVAFSDSPEVLFERIARSEILRLEKTASPTGRALETEGV